MIENEYKYLVPEKMFYKLKYDLSKRNTNSVTSIQINYYYDDAANSLAQNDITLRVRQIGNLLTKQTKQRLHQENSLVVSNEKNDNINMLPLTIDDQYHMLGQMITERHRIYLVNYPGYIDFDRNFYLGICDYEIEIEQCQNYEK